MLNDAIVESNLVLNNDSNYDTGVALSVDDVLLVDVEGLAFRFNSNGQLRWTSRLANKLISFKFHAYKHPKFTGHRRYLSPTIDGRVCYVDETRPPVCLPITVKDIVNFTPFTTPLLPSVYLVGNRNSTILSASIESSGTLDPSNNLNVTFDAINSTSNSQRLSNSGANVKTIESEKCLVDRLKIPFAHHLEDCTLELCAGDLDDQSTSNDGKLGEHFDGFSGANLGLINQDVQDHSIQTIPQNIDNLRDETEQLLISTIRWTVDAFDMGTHVKLWSFTWTEIDGLKGSPDNIKDNITDNAINIDASVNDSGLASTELVADSAETNLINYGYENKAIDSKFILIDKKAVVHTASGTRIINFPFTLASSYKIEKISNTHGNYRRDYTISLIKFAETNDERASNANPITNIANPETKNTYLPALLQITSIALINDSTEPVDTWFFKLPANISYESDKTGIVKTFTDSTGKRIIYSDYIPEDILEYIRMALPPLDYVAWAWFCLIIAYLTIKNNKLSEEVTEFDNAIAQDKDDLRISKSETNAATSIVTYGQTLNISFLENGRFSRTFSCERLLGRGGFGAVYRAKHRLEPGNPEYAIKFVMLRVKDTKDLTSRRCFREVAANRDIYSKYVVRYYTWWCENLSYLPLTDKVDERNEYEEIYQLMKRNALFSNTGKSIGLSLDIQAPTQDSLILFDSDSDSDDSELDDIDHTREKKLSFDSSKFKSEKTDPNKYLTDKIVPERLSLQQIRPYEPYDLYDIDQNTEKRRLKKGKPPETLNQSLQIVLVIQMELCKGCTLRQWLDCPSRPTTDASSVLEKRIELHLFIQLVKGLRDIHERGFIHRDIKPENIFVDPESCHLKIGDFGLVGFMEDKAATAVFTLDSPSSLPITSDRGTTGKKSGAMDSLESSQVSMKGHVIGTPEYAAPEGGASCTDKADIYSASLILLEMLCPRFTTIMERVATLEGFRRSKFVPNYIVQHMNVWYQLMTSMSDVNPKSRPSAKELYRKIRSLQHHASAS
ncbi:Protein kinase domain [Babesia microti strain RI]|uniref:non-specific serine/threonine protein kinase n=1 Tax=Babesia microti (strain RI) TaxID=1133968 RepID=A0A1R4ACF6_BABMR|nr:Protein kinase domain [Babesia microti strain RI]SJK86692.1 Protein kinase domain [Babesia microti strain RI]|eukprot:XP_021338818.1 Protein kinase domain [Babesia microti strain RI]